MKRFLSVMILLFITAALIFAGGQQEKKKAGKLKVAFIYVGPHRSEEHTSELQSH